MFVAGMNFQLDERVGFGRGDALLHAADIGVEAAIDGVADLLAEEDRFVGCRAAPGPSSAIFARCRRRARRRASCDRIGAVVGRGSTSTGPSAMASTWPLRNLATDDGHFFKARFHHPAAADAGGFAWRRDADFNIERIALVNARRQIGTAQAERCSEKPERGSD